MKLHVPEHGDGCRASTYILGLVIGAIMLGYGVTYQVFGNKRDIKRVKFDLPKV